MDPDAWVFPLQHQLKTSGSTSHHGYVYGEVAGESLVFVPDCWTIAKYMGGSFVFLPI